MSTAAVAAIDWHAPWLQPYRAVGQIIAGSSDWVAECNQLAQKREIRNSRALPITFVPQSVLPVGVPYEAHIAQTGCVPTRDNLHDFFNALVWLHFPRTKSRLNQLQFEQLSVHVEGGQFRVGNVRGGLRDATTIFDENAALLVTADDGPLNDLKLRHWQSLLWDKRDEYGQRWILVLFGHALMEKLVKPYKAITAHCYRIHADRGNFSNPASEPFLPLDLRLHAALSTQLRNDSFLPLPVLGVPGWAVDQDEAFYQDEKIFRGLRPRL